MKFEAMCFPGTCCDGYGIRASVPASGFSLAHSAIVVAASVSRFETVGWCPPGFAVAWPPNPDSGE